MVIMIAFDDKARDAQPAPVALGDWRSVPRRRSLSLACHVYANIREGPRGVDLVVTQKSELRGSVNRSGNYSYCQEENAKKNSYLILIPPPLKKNKIK